MVFVINIPAEVAVVIELDDCIGIVVAVVMRLVALVLTIGFVTLASFSVVASLVSKVIVPPPELVFDVVLLISLLVVVATVSISVAFDVFASLVAKLVGMVAVLFA